jgi:phage-related protein
MTEILGFIGVVITLLVIIPASLSALIRVFYQPVTEIVNIWTELIDTILDIVYSIKNHFNQNK